MAILFSLLEWSLFGFSLRDFLDVLVVAGFLYVILLLLKKTHSLFLFNGIGLLFILYAAARFLDLYLTTLFFNFFLSFFVVIFIIVFQRELRHFFEWLSLWRRLPYAKRETIPDFVSGQIIKAVSQLAEARIGALIVISGKQPVDQFFGGGITLNGAISFPLLLSIFDPSSPGHDGAVVVEGNRVKAFGVHLPLAEHVQALHGLGTRHRAALGLAERSDAFVIVVSEERGAISIAYNGTLKKMRDADELRGKLYDFLREHLLAGGIKQEREFFLRRHLREKAIAFLLAGILWYMFVGHLR